MLLSACQHRASLTRIYSVPSGHAFITYRMVRVLAISGRRHRCPSAGAFSGAADVKGVQRPSVRPLSPRGQHLPTPPAPLDGEKSTGSQTSSQERHVSCCRSGLVIIWDTSRLTPEALQATEIIQVYNNICIWRWFYIRHIPLLTLEVVVVYFELRIYILCNFILLLNCISEVNSEPFNPLHSPDSLSYLSNSRLQFFIAFLSSV